MSERIVREHYITEDKQYGVIVVRSALGQVVEYDVYRLIRGEREYIDGGSKRHAQNVFNREIKKPWHGVNRSALDAALITPLSAVVSCFTE